MQPTPPNPAVTLESLLSHAEWVRALARSLVADPNSAEDLEQEVWRAAIESPPRDASNPRGWLASVARNAARSLGRSSARREERERASARGETLPPTSELVAEAELARELADEVLALEEPYRTVLLLRYWRSMSPDEIARAQSIPRETVRTQLKRGLERLREQLDRRLGDRKQWLAALAPLARELPIALGGSATAIGGGVLALTLKFGAAALVAASAWWVWPARVDRVTEQAHLESRPTDPGASLEVADRAPPSRVPVPQGAPSSESGKRGPTHISGCVIDLDAHAIPGLTLSWRRTNEKEWPHWEGSSLKLRRTSVEIPPARLEWLRSRPAEIDKLIVDVGDEPGFRDALIGAPIKRPETTSGPDGCFDIELDGRRWWEVEVSDPHLMVVAVSSGIEQPGWRIAVAPCVSLAGIVVDELGESIEQPSLEAHVRLDALCETREEIERLWQPKITARATGTGRFAFDKAPIGEGARVHVEAKGYAPASIETPTTDEQDLRIVLKRAEALRLSGIVLDEHGDPAAEAEVQLGHDGARTEASGHFEVVVRGSIEGANLTALKPGFQPAIIENFGHSAMSSMSDLVLQLGPPALTISGRVLMEDGTPASRCQLGIADGMLYGSSGCYLENVVDGRRMNLVESDESGRFVVGGLRPRSYRLFALDEELGQLAYSEPIRAGTADVVLRSRAQDFFDQVRGRIVTRRGDGVSRARVLIIMPDLVGEGVSSGRAIGSVFTGPDGRFLLKHVPKEWSILYVSGAFLRERAYPLPTSDGAAIELTAILEIDVRVEVADERVDTVQFLDTEGKALEIGLHTPDGHTVVSELRRRNGTFPLCSVTDDAGTAVLMQGKAEIRRAPVEIRPEKLLTLRL